METPDPIVQQIKREILEEYPDVYNLIVPEELAKKLKIYMSMNTDIKFTIDATKELITRKQKDNVESVVKIALWKSAIVTYAKCFTDASKSNMSKLEANECFKKEPELFEIHREIMSVRHDFIAHRSDNIYEKTIAYFQLPKKTILPYTQFCIKSSRVNNHDLANLEQHLELYNYVQNHIAKKLKKLFNDTAKTIKKKYSKEEIENLIIK